MVQGLFSGHFVGNFPPPADEQPGTAIEASILEIASTDKLFRDMMERVEQRQLLPGTPMLLAHKAARAGKPVAGCTVVRADSDERRILSQLGNVDSAAGIGVDLVE